MMILNYTTSQWRFWIGYKPQCRGNATVSDHSLRNDRAPVKKGLDGVKATKVIAPEVQDMTSKVLPVVPRRGRRCHCRRPANLPVWP